MNTTYNPFPITPAPEPTPVPDTSSSSTTETEYLSAGAIVGIVIGVLVAIQIIAVSIVWYCCFRKKTKNSEAVNLEHADIEKQE